MRITDMTIAQIEAEHEGCYIQRNDAGLIYDDATGEEARCMDVLVWEDEALSEDDDGTNAVARYTIRA